MFGLPLSALPLGFTTPALLAALLLLPALWVLLRVVPPRPRDISFPPTRLLFGLSPREETSSRSPWWLTALRLLLAALLVLAAAGPIWNPPPAGTKASGPLVLVVDQGWAAAAQWQARMSAAHALVDSAEQQGRGIALLPTGDVPRDTTLLTPAATRDRLRSLAPLPYAPPRQEALTRAADILAATPEASLVFLSDGVDAATDATPSSALAVLKDERAQVISGGLPTPLALAAPHNATDALTVKVLRPLGAASLPRNGKVEAKDRRGLLLGEAPFSLGEGVTGTEARFTLPVEMRNDITRLEIAGERSAGAVQLLDRNARRRTVGVISGTSTDRGQPLLAPTYYITRALAPYADLRVAETGSATDNINRFLDERLPILILTDVGTIPEATRARLQHFVEQGGVLVRFSGPRLANTRDDLLPVRLRHGGRVLGGSLSWEEPQKLGALPAEGPFHELHVPGDVTVRRQVLAEPDGTLRERTWATLADGTPLVTGRRIGKGALVLFHVTADASWSSLPLSGTFVDMLRKIITLADTPPAAPPESPDAAQNTQNAPAAPPLAPRQVLDGFGAFTTPGPLARAIPADFRGEASAHHPPGFYGPPESLVAVNTLGPDAQPVLLDFTALGARVEAVESGTPQDLRGPVLLAIMLLVLLDSLAVLWLTGGLSRRGGRNVAALFLAGLLVAGNATLWPAAPAHAQQLPATDTTSTKPATEANAFATQATSQTRFAYVRTGDAAVDDISRQGLDALGSFLRQRTAIMPGDSMGVDLERDELAFFPLIYWPISPDAPPPSPQALARLDAYMKQGGTVVFDTRDAIEGADQPGMPLTPARARLREILSSLDIPALTPIPRDHVLTKAFYLLRDFPGRFTGGTTWVEALPETLEEAEDRPARAGDGVSPIIITSNDLAGAWAVGEDGVPLLPLTPGAPRQREMAFRAGANMAMYVLTGNYKADQVHVPSLLKRLGQ
ncbi:DUF4159 domain-containing protein [Xanthobacter sp. TB0139]|uniref:DUF4159 domain-containing protein n=1 Tax=Xanthobacter sp. TB0139 TaxID=3459178 RepID=UPI00403994F8